MLCADDIARSLNVGEIAYARRFSQWQARVNGGSKHIESYIEHYDASQFQLHVNQIDDSMHRIESISDASHTLNYFVTSLYKAYILNILILIILLN